MLYQFQNKDIEDKKLKFVHDSMTVAKNAGKIHQKMKIAVIIFDLILPTSFKL